MVSVLLEQITAPAIGELTLSSGKPATVSAETDKAIQFGRSLRELFLFDPQYCNLNHGSWHHIRELRYRNSLPIRIIRDDPESYPVQDERLSRKMK